MNCGLAFSQLKEGSMIENRQLYVAVKDWLETYKNGTVKALTYDRLLTAYNLMRSYGISAVQVDALTSKDIQDYLKELVSDNYSMSTIKKQFNLLTAYLKHAMSVGSITVPIYLTVKLPSESLVNSGDKDIEVYTKDEQRALLARLMTLEKDQYGVVVLMLEAGLRIGEALALRWEDVLWNRRAIRIRRTLVRLSTTTRTFVQESPKSKTSRRTVPLSDNAYEILRMLNHRRKSSAYVFGRLDDPSMPYSYSSVEFHIKRLCKDLVISYKGMHAFRHTFATNCYERGCDVKILSKLLGHADVAITYNIYIHLYGDELDEMRKVIG